MSFQLDLIKRAETLRLCLEKKGVTTPPKADLAFVLDVSGSFRNEHRDGITQRLLERLVPWGMLFDPDKKLDVFTFSSDNGAAHRVGEITPETTERYVQDEIVDSVPNYGGGTEYGPVLHKVLQHFGWIKEGFLGRLLHGQKEKRRSIVLFVTDGDNSDHNIAKAVLDESEKRGDQVYFLFLAIGHDSFPFLKRIADKFGNTGLTVIKDINEFTAKTDEQMNDILIEGELVEWLKK